MTIADDIKMTIGYFRIPIVIFLFIHIGITTGKPVPLSLTLPFTYTNPPHALC